MTDAKHKMLHTVSLLQKTDDQAKTDLDWIPRSSLAAFEELNAQQTNFFSIQQ